MERLTVFDGEFWVHQNFPPVEEDRVDEFIDCVKELAARLAAYEDTGLEPEEIARILNAYGRGMTLRTENAQRLEIVKDIQTDRLRELAQADREGRCVVLPCKIFDKIWNVAAHYQFEVTEIDLLPYGNILFRCGNKGTDDYAAFYGDDLGDTFTFEEPQERDNCVVKETTLRREQE